MKKRTIATMLAVMLTVSGLLTGCGGSKEETADTAAESAVEKAAGNGEKQELTLMSVGSSNEQAYIDTMEAVVSDFNENNEYGVEIKIEWYENEQYKTKVPTLMTQNEIGDIFFTWTAGWLQPYVENGKVYSLNDALEADSEWKNRIYDGVLTGTTYGGEVYAIPSTQSVYMIYYNKEIFDNLGLAVPTTWEEFRTVCDTVKASGISPMSMGGMDSWVVSFHMNMLLDGIGGSKLTDDLIAGTTTWEDEAFIEGGKLFQELSDGGIFNDGYLGVDYNAGREVFLSGKSAMYAMGSWDTTAVYSGFGEDSSKVGVFVLPAVNAENQNTTLSQMDKIYAISENCENKEAACAFLRRLTDPDVQAMLVEKTGSVPVAEAAYDENNVDDLTKEIISILPSLTTTIPLSIQYGETTGAEFSNICTAIAGGGDVVEQFRTVQKYMENEMAE